MTRLEAALGTTVAFCERHARAVLVAILALTLLSGAFAWRFASIDSDLGKLIRPSEALAWYRDDLAYKAAFPHLLQTGLVVVSGADFTAVSTTAERLRDGLRASMRFEDVFAPGVDPFLQAHRLYYLTPQDLARWIEGVEYGYGALLRLSEDASVANGALILADHLGAHPGMPLPTLLETLAASFRDGLPEHPDLAIAPPLTPPADGDHYVVVIVRGVQALDQRQPNAELVATLRDIVDATERPEGVRVRLSGEIKLADEEIGAALEGIGLAGTVSIVLLACILGIGVRSARTIGAIFALLGAGVVLTLGWATLAVGSFNTLALIFVIMFFGLGVDFAVHFALRMREDDGPNASASPGVRAARDIGPALLLCGVTSSIAFLSFAPTAYRGLGELGIISAGGMFIAVVLTLTLIPALSSLIGTPGPLAPRASTRETSAVRTRPVLLITAVLALVSVYVARGTHFDYSVLAMRDASTEGMRTLLDLQAAEQSTDYSINVLAPDAMAAQRMARTLERLPEVAGVTLPGDLVPERQQEKRALLDDLAALLDTLEPVTGGAEADPIDPAAAADYLSEMRPAIRDEARADFDAFVQALEASSGTSMAALDARLAEVLSRQIADLRRLVNAQPFTLDVLPDDLRRLTIAADGRHLLRVQPANTLDSRQATEAFVTAVAAAAPNIAGRTVVEWGVGAVVVEAFLQATGLAAILILLVLFAYFRSWRAPLLVMTPIALSLLFTAAIARIIDLDLNMANILVVPLVIGLGVDTGIHVVHRFRHDGGLDAMRRSTTPRAVLIAGLTTIGTFLSLTLSPHKGAASIGLLLFVAIGTMLAVTFVVLPALLRATEGEPPADAERGRA